MVVKIKNDKKNTSIKASNVQYRRHFIYI